MSDFRCKALCPSFPVLQWKQGDNTWEKQEIYAEQLRVKDRGQCPSIILEDTEVFIVIASAKIIQQCPQCREIFIHTFCMPRTLWTGAIQNSNGYFGCESTSSPNLGPGINTWAYFEIKHLEPNLDYEWSQIRLFTRWHHKTNQTALLLFDPTSRINQIPEPDSTHLKDPFWIYTHILDEIVILQDSAVWAIRDHIRPIEKAPKPVGRPQPNYRGLHDIARHTVHITETLDVASQNIEQILRHHLRYTNTANHGSSNNNSSSNTDVTATISRQQIFMNVHSKLEFAQSCLNSLRHRAIANEKRLQNEIQLAFNTVAQHDASLSVKISHAMMSDSTALKTLAFVTFIFLPPTFISSIFSMTFFNYDNGVFSVAGEIWIYWAFAIPTTLISTIVWQFWHKISPKERKEAPLKHAATFTMQDIV
ncbi:hypothetical protein PENSTE_c005G00931 [Penicillium steckii]|uniref:Uncharacterized protein n=1 Tax=Penicillium steckii TaxID=303698 RepID=A0A1V6TKW5_9EURO|nr:hypothetical protein PENSTE_c005G00931 [Penicillium steckii]